MKLRLILLCVASLAIAACGSSSSTAPSSVRGSASSSSAAPASPSAAPAAAQSPFLAGNAHPQYPAGTPGQVSVVYHAPIQPQANGTAVPLVFRNNTKASIAHVDITAAT